MEIQLLLAPLLLLANACLRGISLPGEVYLTETGFRLKSARGLNGRLVNKSLIIAMRRAEKKTRRQQMFTRVGTHPVRRMTLSTRRNDNKGEDRKSSARGSSDTPRASPRRCAPHWPGAVRAPKTNTHRSLAIRAWISSRAGDCSGSICALGRSDASAQA